MEPTATDTERPRLGGGIDQFVCIQTAQGFEVDYVGVIFGDDLVYRPREGWFGREESSYDGGLKRGTSDEDFTRLVRNTTTGGCSPAG